MGYRDRIVLSKRPSLSGQRGENNPLYYETASELREHVLRLYNDPDFYEEVRSYLLRLAPAFYPAARAGKLEQTLRDLANGSRAS